MATSDQLKVVIFLGSTREGRMGQRVYNFVHKWIKENKKYDAHLIDAAELDLPMLKKPMHFYRSEHEIPHILAKTNQMIKEADAYILISCEYNNCIPPALSNMLDHFPPPSFEWKASGIITYSMGPYGGTHAGMQLRAMTSELGCLSVKHMVGIPKVHVALTEDGDLQDESEGCHMVSSLAKLMKDLEWHALAMKYMRENNGVPK